VEAISKGNGKVVPAYAMNAYRESGVINPLILSLRITWDE